MRRTLTLSMFIGSVALLIGACDGDIVAPTPQSANTGNNGGLNNGGPNNNNNNNGGPNNGGPNNTGENNGGPNNGDPNNGGPNNGDPNNGDPNNGDPNNGDPNNGGVCVPTLTHFEDEVWPFMGDLCFACHGDGGIGAQNSNLDLIAVDGPDDLMANFDTVRAVAARQSGGTSLLLLKPSGQIAHGGGGVLNVASESYAALEVLVGRFEAPVSCDLPPDNNTNVNNTNPDPDPHTLHPNNLDQGALFTCEDPGAPRSSPARLRRLSRVEWIRNVGKWQATQDRGWHGATAANNPFDQNPANDYATYDADTSIDLPSLDLYLGMIEEAGVGWQEVYGGTRLQRLREDRTLRCMYEEPPPDAACIDNWVSVYLEEAVLFRAPTEEEHAQLEAFATQAVQDEVSEGLSREETIAHITSAAWLTTGALFRTEMGQGAPDADGRRRMSGVELGHAVTYALSDRAPGAPATYISASYTAPLEGYFEDIQAAIADGSIDAPGTIEQLVAENAGGLDPERADLSQDWGEERRMARAEYWVADKIGSFFREWLDYGDVATAFKDRPEATSQFDEGETSQYRSIKTSFDNLQHGYYGKESLLSQQLDDMIARIVAEDQNVLYNLLTSTRMYVASSLRYADTSISGATTNPQRPYNITGETGFTREERWVDLPASERAGVLTHPAWLAAHGGNFENDPSVVYRGKWIREELLCEQVPPLSLVMVDASLDPQTDGRPARERIANRIDSNSECTGCHSLMNPLGLTFEIYNHAGFTRAEDHGGPPDGSSVLDNMPDDALNGPVEDAVALMHKLADSPHVKQCFVRQTFRYFMGRHETEADACTLVEMEESYDASSGSFVTMLQTLMTSDTFVYRHNAPEEE